MLTDLDEIFGMNITDINLQNVLFKFSLEDLIKKLLKDFNYFLCYSD